MKTRTGKGVNFTIGVSVRWRCDAIACRDSISVYYFDFIFLTTDGPQHFLISTIMLCIFSAAKGKQQYKA